MMEEKYLICHAAAKHPLRVRELDQRLYTAEELSYYIYNNAALLDDSFLSPELLSFLRREVGMPELADRIERHHQSPADLDSILLMILRETAYYDDAEIAQFQETLVRLSKQNRLERSRERADQLFLQNRPEQAIREYSGIITARRDGRLKPYFYAQVLQHMGAAYMQLGLSDEALECLKVAWKESPEPFLLKQMFFWAMETGKPYPKELEQVDAGQLSDWQQTFLEVQNRHLAAIQNEEGQLAFYEEGEARDQALDRFLEQEKQQYRTMIMGARLKNA